MTVPPDNLPVPNTSDIVGQISCLVAAGKIRPEGLHQYWPDNFDVPGAVYTHGRPMGAGYFVDNEGRARYWVNGNSYIWFGSDGLERHTKPWAIYSANSARTKAEEQNSNSDFIVSASAYDASPNRTFHSYDMARTDFSLRSMLDVTNLGDPIPPKSAIRSRGCRMQTSEDYVMASGSYSCPMRESKMTRWNTPGYRRRSTSALVSENTPSCIASCATPQQTLMPRHLSARETEAPWTRILRPWRCLRSSQHGQQGSGT